MNDCYFCKQNIKEVDFKEIDLLKNFITGLGKIRSRKKTGLCKYHQRRIAQAIKRARNLGLLSPTEK